MRLIEFFPGEGSRFIVAATRISEADARPAGGTNCAVLITFGTEHHLCSALFEAHPILHPYLDPVKIAQRMPGLDLASLIAATHVIAEVLERVPLGPIRMPEHLDWSPDWKVQLIPLKVAIGTAKCEIQDSTPLPSPGATTVSQEAVNFFT